tara:strand:+ start:352 stop:984 length:633 start_codon:yes stop_codon:yes gene_type:complete
VSDSLDFDFTSLLQGRFAIYATIIPLIVIFSGFIIYIIGVDYQIESELSISSDETRIHNFGSGTYFIQSLDCTESLFEENKRGDELEDAQAWENCDKIEGYLNFTMTEQLAMNNTIVNSTTVKCDWSYTSTRLFSESWYYCYGGIKIMAGQYEVANDSPFDIILLDVDEDNHEFSNLIELIPFISILQGYFACCIIFPITVVIYFVTTED